jgi:hypothetical protein
MPLKQDLVAHLATPTDSIVRDYLALRRAIGWLGFLLPFAVSLAAAFPHSDEQSSISLYYYTHSRNILVGVLCAIGVFLLFYKGQQRIDAWLSGLAGAFAIGVAMFPTSPAKDATDLQTHISYVHYTSAALFFAAITGMTLFLFTKTDQAVMSARKQKRNLVYKVCGTIMAVAVLALLAQAPLSKETKDLLASFRYTYWLETAAIVAFGIAWLTKGEAILKELPPDDPGVSESSGAHA